MQVSAHDCWAKGRNYSTSALSLNGGSAIWLYYWGIIIWCTRWLFFVAPPQAFPRKYAPLQTTRLKSAHPLAYPEKDITWCLSEKNNNPVVIGKKKSLPPNAANYASHLTFFPSNFKQKNSQVHCLFHEKKKHRLPICSRECSSTAVV
jgi:hypothetical protein